MNTVSNEYHMAANGGIRHLDWEVGISWDKKASEDIGWFTLNQSKLNGGDKLADSSDNPLQPWDAYAYASQKDRVIELNIERSVAFPYNIQSAICDVKLNNYDGYYSVENPSSSLANYILPGRPLRTYLGFAGVGVTPVFVGTTQKVPEYSGTHNTTAQLTAMDFLAQIAEMSMSDTTMLRDVRVDEVIEIILQKFGLTPHMYKIAYSSTVIPFVYFDSGKNAGNALKELVQAENGAMWVDENGMVRFSSRSGQVNKESVMTFTPENIVKITPSQTSDIVNRVYIEADVRQVQEPQVFFSVDNEQGYTQNADNDPYRLPANKTTTVWFNFDDPIWSAGANPVLQNNGDVSRFSVVNLNGGSINSGITAKGTLFAKAIKVDFTNSLSVPVSINYLQFWGEPAKIVGQSPTIKYTAQNNDSIDKFGVHELSITDNTCFGNQINVESFANEILRQYSGYSPTLDLEVKGDPSLQMHDMVTLSGTNYDGLWLVKSISHNLKASKLTTKISVTRTTVLNSFILNQSMLNGTDVLT